MVDRARLENEAGEEHQSAYRFGDCQLDVTAYELRRHARAVRVERRPMELLIMLVERRGELVTRDESSIAWTRAPAPISPTISA